MESLSAEVALIVKAPNQQTADVKVRAEITWTIRQLKAHLSEVYPSKPNTEEQKIIYSGQLLGDHTILKDVLRVYEGQEAYTVHLVCIPKRFGPEQRTTEQTLQESQPVDANMDSADGLRRRNVAENRPPEIPRPEMRQNNQNHTAEMQNFYSRMLENYGRVPPAHNMYPAAPQAQFTHPALANHMLMMQQAYVQYMQQYANMWQAAGANNLGVQVQPVNVANEPAAPQPAVAADAPQGAAELQDEDGEGGAPRDWLDWLYAISRLMILFSLLYFYSSPLRLALVTLLAVLGYLYQLGFFREVGLDGRQNEQPQVQPQAQPQAQPRPHPHPVDAGQNEVRPDNATDETPSDEPANRPQGDNINQQSFLMTTWIIFTSFFTSLIPDTPNVV